MRSPAPISVVIPVYDCKYLAEAIDSVLGQTLPPLEVIVVDDGSPEHVELPQPGPVRVVRQENRGVSAARNAGIREATGSWISFLDADDIWHPQKLELQWQAIRLCPDVGVVFSDFSKFSGTQEHVPSFFASADSGYGRLQRNLVAENTAYFPEIGSDFWEAGMFLSPCTAVVRRDILDSVGLFREDLRFCEDSELFLRVLARAPMAVVEQPLSRYRDHGANSSKYLLGIYLDYFKVTEQIVGDPGQYPPGAAHAFTSRLAEKYMEAGRLMLDEQRRGEAREMFRKSLQSEWSLHTTSLLASTWVSRSIFDRLIAVKRWVRPPKNTPASG